MNRTHWKFSEDDRRVACGAQDAPDRPHAWQPDGNGLCAVCRGMRACVLHDAIGRDGGYGYLRTPNEQFFWGAEDRCEACADALRARCESFVEMPKLALMLLRSAYSHWFHRVEEKRMAPRDQVIAEAESCGIDAENAVVAEALKYLTMAYSVTTHHNRLLIAINLLENEMA